MARIWLVAPWLVLAKPLNAAAEAAADEAAEVEVVEVVRVGELLMLRPRALAPGLMVGLRDRPPPGLPGAACAAASSAEAAVARTVCRRPRAKAAPAIGRTGKPAVP
ncbi:MAG TPA: hypothetical protein VMF65_22345 [Acidimicrobiales bacterium]|nr:hypothetical protein [Acidimicrobiales bacterium]